jgi:hypothetical protein
MAALLFPLRRRVHQIPCRSKIFMKYAFPFHDPQSAVAPLHVLAQVMSGRNVLSGLPSWCVAKSPEHDGVVLLASLSSKAVLVLADDEVVFAAHPDGHLQRYAPGLWVETVAALFDEAVSCGALINVTEWMKADAVGTEKEEGTNEANAPDATAPDAAQASTVDPETESKAESDTEPNEDDGAACPWMDTIETTREPWEVSDHV